MEINKENLEAIHLSALDFANLCAEELQSMKTGIENYPSDLKQFAVDHVQKFIGNIFYRITSEAKPINN